MAQKATVTLEGVSLAGIRGIVWRLQTGTTPYQTTMQVHRTQWKNNLSRKVAKPLTLKFTDSTGRSQTIKEVYILHEVATDSPNRVTFLVSDRRWKWPRVLVARDYNIPKRSGDRTLLNEKVPAGTETIVDKYDYKDYSLKGGEKRWTAQEAVEDVLSVITKNETNKWTVVSFPIEQGEGEEEEGGFSLQNIVLRDGGDVALARVLAAVPGSAVYITTIGQAHVIDAADLEAGEELLKTVLSETTWSGEFPRFIDRKAMRPKRVLVHYQREVELLVEFEDDLDATTQIAPFGKTDAYCQNVIPTVDPTTKMDVWNPETFSFDKDVKVPAGTYVNVEKWLEAMEKLKPTGSWPWTYEMVKTHFFATGMEAVWFNTSSRGVVDNVVDGNVASRIQTFMQHFRQTFKINPHYMERIRSLAAVLVKPVDPVTGARAPAGVWSQATITHMVGKGDHVYQRRNPARSGIWLLVDNTPVDEGSGVPDVKANHPSAARLTFLDRDQGIFRVDWVLSPFGTEASILPCHVSNVSGDKQVPIRQIKEQDEGGMMGPQLRREGDTNENALSNTLILKAIMTIVPGAPNNKKQYHVEVVEASDVKELYQSNYRIDGGEGPDMEVFISPGEVTARFSWGDQQLTGGVGSDAVAREQMKQLLGTRDDDPVTAGLPDDTTDITGFTFVNHEREIKPHAQAVAAEVLAGFADNVMGRVATRLPKQTLEIKGNIRSAEIRVGAFPSAKIDAVHDFPGLQVPVSRFALLPDASRKLILGIIDGVRPNE